MYGFLLVRCGNTHMLPINAGNCFSFLKDEPLKESFQDRNVGKPDLFPGLQKPIKFFKSLINLFTLRGETILD